MGVFIRNMHSHYEFSNGKELEEQPGQVLALAVKVISPILQAPDFPENISHLIVATTCPDMLAPSLGQMIVEKYHAALSRCHTIDIVQGCAGGVTAMILGSQLAAMHGTPVLVVQADAAKKATSKSVEINKIFGNGAFACLLDYDNSSRDLMHHMSRQYKGLSKVVTVKLGHDTDQIITLEKDIAKDPRKHLGLSMDNALAIRLLKNAEQFYLDFIENRPAPDIMILHQVNPLIVKHLESVFAKYPMQFVDVASVTGNCGVASVGIALSKIKDTIAGKQVLLCSFGTGGVITAGLWQN